MNLCKRFSQQQHHDYRHQTGACSGFSRERPDKSSRDWLAWLFSGLGMGSLVWFLLRVIPKPSRAAYPCQRIAFPLASGFVTWVLALIGSGVAWRKARTPRLAFWKAFGWSVLAMAGGLLLVFTFPRTRVSASSNPAHGPLGQAKGIFPGRVAWVYAPAAVNWAGESSSENWWQTNHTDLGVVEEMMSTAIRSVAGANSDAGAWKGIFTYFNQEHGRGQRGYQAGEKIAIKINLTTCNGRDGDSTVAIYSTYEKRASIMNTIDNSPQRLLSLLRQLVYKVGVAQADISLGDPTADFPQYMWNMLHPEFPDVQYFDNYGHAGRVRTELSVVPFNWSTPEAVGCVQDYVPVPFAQADYLINFAILKGHSVGVTLCGKNLYGALLRCPDGYYRDANGPDQGGILNYLSMHASTPLPSVSGVPGLGHYRAIVDLMGHPALGGKTLLCLVDGLFGGYFWDSHPHKWNMPPFNGNWPSSLFASQDPVAVDSVCYDFLLNEWPNVVQNGTTTPGNSLGGGAEDYLHEAALADQPPSKTIYNPGRTQAGLASLGVHEHWNNPIDKQYSRNLGTGLGIELVPLAATHPKPVLTAARIGDALLVSWPETLTGYRLQSATNLGAPAPWSDVVTALSLLQGQNTVSNTWSDPDRFFRLTK
jgi:hypothetical protein